MSWTLKTKNLEEATRSMKTWIVFSFLKKKVMQSGVPSLLQEPIPDNLRWSCCNNNRNQVHDKCLNPPQITPPRSMEASSSSRKPAPGAKKVGDRWRRMQSVPKEGSSFQVASGSVSLSGCKEQQEELPRTGLRRIPGFSAPHGPHFSCHGLRASAVRTCPSLGSIRTKVYQAVSPPTPGARWQARLQNTPAVVGEAPPEEEGRHLLFLTSQMSQLWDETSTFCLQNIIYIKTKKRKNNRKVSILSPVR